MRYHQFTRQAQLGQVSAINILSSRTDVYTAEAVIQDRCYTIERRDSREPLCFTNYRDARRWSASLSGIPVNLQVSYAYEEMIGEPGLDGGLGLEED